MGIWTAWVLKGWAWWAKLAPTAALGRLANLYGRSIRIVLIVGPWIQVISIARGL